MTEIFFLEKKIPTYPFPLGYIKLNFIQNELMFKLSIQQAKDEATLIYTQAGSMITDIVGLNWIIHTPVEVLNYLP